MAFPDRRIGVEGDGNTPTRTLVVNLDHELMGSIHARALRQQIDFGPALAELLHIALDRAQS